MRSCIPLLASALLLFGPPSVADDGSEKWAKHDPGAWESIDHSLWGNILAEAIVPYEEVKDVVSRSKWDCRHTRSRIPTCDTSKYGNENLKGVALVPYKYFRPEFDFYIRSYLRKMSEIEIRKYNRKEQLAYWLNLHNAAVMHVIYEEYPVDSVAKLRPDPGESPKEDFAWTRPIIEIDGVSLSIRDIEREVLFANWQEPRILYGLYDGAVGGPALMKEPFEGWRVYGQLRRNGYDYVNSRRAMRLFGDELNLSHVFDYGRSLFKGASGVVSHLGELAAPSLQEKLAAVDEILFDYRDLTLAEYRASDNFQDRAVLGRHVDYNGRPNP